MARLVRLPCALLLALASCGGDPGPEPSGSLVLHVDGAQVAVVSAQQLTDRLDLRGIEGVPAPETWRVLEARAAGRIMQVRDPATRYRDQDVALFLDDAGRPSVGIFRRDRPELTEEVRRLIREPTVALRDASTLELRTREDTRPAPKTPELLVVVGAQEPQALAGNRLQGLTPLEGAPHGDGMPRKEKPNRRRKGRSYHLADVLALVVSSPIASARLVSGDGREVVVDQALLAARAGTMPSLKLNRRGQFNYRPVGASDGPQLRDIRRVEVTLRD